MKIPKKMTEQQVIDQINIVVNRLAHKYTFGTYDIEDIKQEAFIICMDALNRYDQKRPLENFLSVHLSNRLKNFVRDNYYTKDEDQKKKVMKPSYITQDNDVSYEHNLDDSIEAKKIQEIIDKNLPSSYRADYIKLIHDVSIPKKRKQEILAVIKDILETYLDEEG